MRSVAQRIFFVALLVILIGSVGLAQSNDQSVGQDMKDAGHATKQAAKKTGHKVKRGVKKGTHKAAKKTREGAEKVEDKTATPPQ